MMFIYFTDTDPVYFIQSSSGAEMISSKHVITNNTDMERLGITLLIFTSFMFSADSLLVKRLIYSVKLNA